MSPRAIRRAAERAAINQANAQRSTGPTSEAGRQISAQNRRTHGLTGKFVLLPSESQEEFDALQAGLHAEYAPETIVEAQYVHQLAQNMWLRDRALRLITNCFDPVSEGIRDQDAKKFGLYLRYQTTAERTIDRCVNQLLKLRKEKRQAEIGFESQKAKSAAEQAKARLNHARAHCQELENVAHEGMLGPVPHFTAEEKRVIVADELKRMSQQAA